MSYAANFLDAPIQNVVHGIISWVMNFILTIASGLVIASGLLLSVSINITTNLGVYFDSMPVMREIWLIVRNISSIFIIFALIYASISTILDIGKNNVRELVINIIKVGLLINFSLFFARVAIDASNLVSLQFYRAIAPQSGQTKISKLSSAYYDGGLSNVFMNSLKIQTVYNNSNSGFWKATDIAFNMSVAMFFGVIMMVTASISFLGASIMFMARTAILLFCMAMSPLYFAAMIFPNVKEYSDKIMKQFKAQLLFMPTYLFLMYIALRVISSPGFNSVFGADPNSNSTAGEGAFGITLAGTIIQYVIALVFLNIPLIAAISAGGMGAKFAGDLTSSMNGWLKKQPGNLASGAWRNTGSRVASRVANSTAMQRFAGTSFVGQGIRTGLTGVAGEYNTRLNQRIANREATYNSLTDSQARTDYSRRLTGSLQTRSGLVSMATTGRADRVGASRILTRRQTEITAEINRMLARRRQLEDIVRGNPGNNIPPRTLSYVEQQEYNDIGTAAQPGAALTRENNNLDDIRRQMIQFQVNTGGQMSGHVRVPGRAPIIIPGVTQVTGGATPSQVNRRNY